MPMGRSKKVVLTLVTNATYKLFDLKTALPYWRPDKLSGAVEAKE
jgi:hypothetical protein